MSLSKEYSKNLEILPADFKIEHIVDFFGNRKRSGYLFVTRDFQILEAGGDLEFFGLNNPGKGKKATDLFPFLEGLFPLDTSKEVFPYVQLASESYTDILLREDNDGKGYWILFFDTTNQGLWRQNERTRNNLSALNTAGDKDEE